MGEGMDARQVEDYHSEEMAGTQSQDQDGGEGLCLFDLPNEILVSIMAPFRTHDLLPLACVSRRFHAIVLRILHYRLLLAASAPEYKIIVEAYLPSRRWTRPFFHSTYLGTNGLSSTIEGQGSLYEDMADGKVSGKLSRLSGLYSRFRVEYPGVKGSMPVRRVAGAAPNLQSNIAGLQTDWYAAPSQTPDIGLDNSNEETAVDVEVDTEGVDDAQTADPNPQQAEADNGDGQQVPHMQPIWDDSGDGGNKRIVYQLDLDDGESFAQFCLGATLVRLGPRRGIFLSYVPIVGEKQGVLRLWRHWLEKQADQEAGGNTASYGSLQRSLTNLGPEIVVNDPAVIWTDTRKNVGLKFGVKELFADRDNPRQSHFAMDDIAMSFELQIEELIVRTTSMMLAVEESAEQEKTPGKSLIFGSFAVAAE